MGIEVGYDGMCNHLYSIIDLGLKRGLSWENDDWPMDEMGYPNF